MAALVATLCSAKPTEKAEGAELFAVAAESSAGIEAAANLTFSSAGIDVKVDGTDSGAEDASAGIQITTDFTPEYEATTDSVIETTADSTEASSGVEVTTDTESTTDSGIEMTTDFLTEMDVATDSGIETTTDSSAGIEVTTECADEVTTDPSGIELKANRSSRIKLTTDPSAGIQVTTDLYDDLDVTTDPSAGMEVTTDPSGELEVTTDPSAGIEVTTDSLMDVTAPPEEELETVTPIIFPEGPEATTFLAEANYFDELTELTTTPESLLLEATTDSWDYSAATTDYPELREPVTIPARRNKPLSGKKKNYEGYRVLRVLLVTDKAIDRILRMEDVPGVTFWADPKLLLRPRGRFVTSAADVMVSPKALPSVEDIFRQGRLSYSVLIDNVQEAIANENIALSPFARAQFDDSRGHQLTWQRYHRLSDIDSFLVYLEETYPDLVDIVEIGQSSEGRPIKLVKMGRQINVPRSETKKSILIDAGVHANEWITTSSVTWMLNEISSNGERYDCILDRFDWLWIPLLNPDGYEYAHTVDRMWRKTRRNYTSTMSKSRQGTIVQPIDPAAADQLSDCIGADINRNFEFYWRKGGSSSNVCSASFAGVFPFSEPESRALANYVLKHKKDMAMYISLHAYSQMWLLPWGFSEERPKDFGRLFSLAKIGAAAVQRVHNTTFLIGSVPDLLYRSSGNSQDWVKAVAGVDYSYTVEMRDAGESGRILPSKQIVDSSEETWAGLYAVARELATRLYPHRPQCPSFN